MSFKCAQCGEILSRADTKHTFEDCMKYELAQATTLLVKHKAWDIARQVISYIQIQIKETCK